MSHLKFVQVAVELLKAFKERGEAGRRFWCGGYPGLDDSLLVQQGLQSQ